ncbi:MAG: hypothetical protein KDB80_04415 [Planctomycetes bacterium]|nr:hypothetical protein [Planctomycetota bacterium]
MLRTDFVVGWKNIRREDYVGYSCGYDRRQTAVATTNGAGPRNTQIFVLSPDLVVLHALPGFWHPDDLARELRFAKRIAKLWEDQGKSVETKTRMYRRMHRREVYTQSPETYARSTWQNFDAHFERHRGQSERRDTFLRDANGEPVTEANGTWRMKPINVLVHERMSRRPFVAWDDFDLDAFVDYGTLHYDNNRGVDRRHREFRGQERLKKQRERATR